MFALEFANIGLQWELVLITMRSCARNFVYQLVFHILLLCCYHIISLYHFLCAYKDNFYIDTSASEHYLSTYTNDDIPPVGRLS